MHTAYVFLRIKYLKSALMGLNGIDIVYVAILIFLQLKCIATSLISSTPAI